MNKKHKKNKMSIKIPTKTRVLPPTFPTENFINHISHIQNIPNPKQTQYMTYTHSQAWSFSKEKKCKKKNDIN